MSRLHRPAAPAHPTTGGRPVTAVVLTPGVDRLVAYRSSDPVAAWHRAVRRSRDSRRLMGSYLGPLVDAR